ncbi:MAG: bifunctional phosphopantothenoylcysteine decarboxylase/phosphopantothenate--cysteine ligase CoaBC [Flavobacteriales bacterium]|nr:bifunctional phosphopantothenoylcysteine decarboxylase/phosphopantothenate--cysteine ligase CoaBC [Flavobacteriales bacterium]
MLKGKNILLGITGGIAAYKTPILVRLLKKSGANIKVIMTPAAKEFVSPVVLSTLSENPIFTEFVKQTTSEWNSHVELAQWADLFVIAPATANILGKITAGICDNLLLATYFSAKCPVFIAPAMDLDMYKHPVTTENIRKIKFLGNKIIDATEGELASGLIGKGRMEEPEQITKIIIEYFNKNKPLKNKVITITAGPTYENIDPVRFIGNHSSGKMGVALAKIARELGAEVHLIIGPNNLEIDNEINKTQVVSAEEMYKAVHKLIKKTNIFIMSAAVADYTPIKINTQKIKKSNTSFNIELKPTKDILKSVGEIKNSKQILVGFALETENEISNAKNKLKSKNLDLIVLNSLNDKSSGFGFDTNKITLIDKNNKVEKLELKSKTEVAVDILNKIVSLLNK